MAAAQNQRAVYASAGWEIDLARRQLRSKGAPVPLGSRAFEIIAELVQAGGDLLSKDELAKRVWRGVHVDEGALRVHMVAIRKALGADRQLLNNSAGRGYRLWRNTTTGQIDNWMLAYS
jgi:DNA-binding winged helix-turn-helix (wHTH) protein